MKTITSIFALAASASALAATYVNKAIPIDGTNSYSAAAYSGAYSSGNFVTAVGSSSFRQAQGNNAVAVGAMALSASGGSDSCVMIGDYAGFGTTNLRRCVGIGTGAMMGWQNAYYSTSVNGQFVARGDKGQFWLTPDCTSTANWDGCPPIFYDNGTLYLNARQIVTRSGVVERQAPLWTTDWTLAASNAIYVAEYGNDSYHGLSAYYAKRTLQAAIEAVANDDTTIYVDRGVYESPEYLNGTLVNTAHPLTIVGVGGRDSVIIDCGGKRKMSAGSSGYVCVMQNLTIRNPSTPIVNLSNENRGALQLLMLVDCNIVATNMTVRSSQWPFAACILERCNVDIGVSATGDGGNWQYSVIFGSAMIYDSVVKIRTNSDYAVNLGSPLIVENSFFDIDKLDTFRLPTGRWMNIYSCFYDSTLVLGAANTLYTSGRIANSVLGFGTDGPGDYFSGFSVRTSATDLAARLDAETHRPNSLGDFELLPFGYNSAKERSVRDGAVAAVMDALTAAGDVTEPQAAAFTRLRTTINERNNIASPTRPNRLDVLTYTFVEEE